MLKCREVTQLCSRELEEPLTLGQRLALRVHLMVCVGCSNFRRQMFMLHDAARRYADGKAASTGDDRPPPV